MLLLLNVSKSERLQAVISLHPKPEDSDRLLEGQAWRTLSDFAGNDWKNLRDFGGKTLATNDRVHSQMLSVLRRSSRARIERR